MHFGTIATPYERVLVGYLALQEEEHQHADEVPVGAAPAPPLGQRLLGQGVVTAEQPGGDTRGERTMETTKQQTVRRERGIDGERPRKREDGIPSVKIKIRRLIMKVGVWGGGIGS